LAAGIIMWSGLMEQKLFLVEKTDLLQHWLWNNKVTLFDTEMLCWIDEKASVHFHLEWDIFSYHLTREGGICLLEQALEIWSA
jgi:hypothetical protein